MRKVMCQDYGNPSSMHRKGVEAEKYVKEAKERLAKLQQELAEEEKHLQNRRHSDNEKRSVEHVQKLREQIEQLNREIETAQQNYDLNKAAELQYGRLPQLQKQLEEEEEKVKDEDLSLVHESVIKNDEIAKIRFPAGQEFQ